MLYTIGYSSFFDPLQLLNKLKENNILFLFDIRTFPYSNAFPQYNEPKMKNFLENEGIKYKFFGDYLGGLTIKKEVKKGINNLKDLIKNEKIKKGLNYLYKISQKENIAIMCAEKSPFDCHRFLAVGSLMHFYTDIKVINIIENKILSVEESISWWKKSQNLNDLKISDEKLVFQRLNYIYKTLNKREEKYPGKIENFKLFQ